MKRRWWVGFGLFVGVGLTLCQCGGAPYAQGDPQTLVPGSQAERIALDAGRQLHVVRAGQASATPVLFVHGTPGSWEAWAAYLARADLQQRYQLIAVDRPGFGLSDPGRLALGLAEQAALIANAIPVGQQAIIVGHSLGGPIAVQLAADFPDRVQGLVLVAGSFDPALEAPRWYNRLAGSRIVRWALPDAWRAANDEVMVLAEELQALEPRWASLALPMVILQGAKDRLVYPANVDFAEARVPAEIRTTVRIEDEGHFIPWTRPDVIVDAIQNVGQHPDHLGLHGDASAP